jgi:hypothetical protein
LNSTYLTLVSTEIRIRAPEPRTTFLNRMQSRPTVPLGCSLDLSFYHVLVLRHPARVELALPNNHTVAAYYSRCTGTTGTAVPLVVIATLALMAKWLSSQKPVASSMLYSTCFFLIFLLSFPRSFRTRALFLFSLVERLPHIVGTLAARLPPSPRTFARPSTMVLVTCAAIPASTAMTHFTQPCKLMLDS